MATRICVYMPSSAALSLAVGMETPGRLARIDEQSGRRAGSRCRRGRRLPGCGLGRDVVAQRDRLYGLALVILRESNDASDAVQSAFEKALRHRGRLLVGVRPEAWLARITCNEAISLARRRRIRRWVAFVARWLLACITLARSCARFWTNIGMIDEGANHDRDH